MVEVFKNLHIYDESIRSEKFTPRTRPRRQHDYELQRNFANDGMRGYQSNSLFYRSVKPWNDLEEDIVEAPSLQVFKERLIKEWEKKLYKM